MSPVGRSVDLTVLVCKPGFKDVGEYAVPEQILTISGCVFFFSLTMVDEHTHVNSFVFARGTKHLRDKKTKNEVFVLSDHSS